MKQRLETHLLGLLALVAGGACLAPSIAGAQQGDPHRNPPAAAAAKSAGARTANQAKDSALIPASSRPPKGMCRVWLNDVPASQQPAATDCATAVRNRPQNGRVIFGDDYSRAKADSAHNLVPAVKGFLQMKKPAPGFGKPPA